VESWNLAVQRSLPFSLALDVSYVGNHALFISNSNVINNGTVNLNAATVAGSGTAGEPEYQAFGRTANTTYPSLQGSHYEALQMKLNRKFTNGFQMNTSYAFGKAIDYSPYNALGIIVKPGVIKYNRKNIFTYSATYELPFGAGKKMFTSGPGKWVLAAGR